MKSNLLAIAFTLLSLFTYAQKDERIEPLVKEGIALHDKGDYPGAIKKYDEALAIDKNDYDANYEKSLSCLYLKKYDDCIAISKFLLEKYAGSDFLPGVYVNYGSALDDKGDSEAALKVFSEGIQKFSSNHLLYFNRGLTYGKLNREKDALESFYAAMQIKPTHAGSLYYTAFYLEKENKMTALISGLTFLAVEPEGKRAEAMYKYVNELLGSFAKKNGDNGTIISINVDKKNKENDFHMTEMILGLTIASGLTDSVKAKTDVEKLSLDVQMMANSLATGLKDGKGLFWKIYAPFWAEMNKKELIPTYAHIAAITSGNEQNIKWINDNQDKLTEYYDWLNAYKWTKKN